MKNIFLLLLSSIFCIAYARSQPFVSMQYSYQQLADIPYGSARDFGGNQRTLLLDLCTPVGDVPPPCGRPLVVIIHGGSFITGDKTDAIPRQLMEDFAKRGYVSASINYRLGFFQTSSNVHCNISALGAPWDCLNAADTAEWERAAYRGMQDAKGAIRYLTTRAGQYRIDPRNVFVIGESAGGFIALNTAFMDDPAEKPGSCGALPAVPAPNAIYEGQCITTYKLDTSIASLQLSRPDLGSIDGDMNVMAPAWQIKGIGNFYGAVFQDLFTRHTYPTAPVLYLYHQPNDLLVPYNNDRVFAGYAYCATLFPANCQYIINRPFLYGSSGIKSMIASSSGNILPQVIFDSTNNTADCFTQLNNPTLSGHSIDNYVARTNHLALVFAAALNSDPPCIPTAITTVAGAPAGVFFNAKSGNLNIPDNQGITAVQVYDLNGRLISATKTFTNTLDLNGLTPGVYVLRILTIQQVYYQKMIKP